MTNAFSKFRKNPALRDAEIEPSARQKRVTR